MVALVLATTRQTRQQQGVSFVRKTVYCSPARRAGNASVSQACILRTFDGKQWIRRESNLGEANKTIEVIESGPEWRCIVKIVISTSLQGTGRLQSQPISQHRIDNEEKKESGTENSTIASSCCGVSVRTSQNRRLSRTADHCLFW